MKNLSVLLEKAKWSKLDNEELQEVIQRVENFNEKEGYQNLYTLLHILGKSEARDYRGLVEKFLVFPNEPMISRISLKILCDYWGFTEEYLPYIKAYLNGVHWDEAGEIRLIAISISGEFLRKKKNDELLKLLLVIYENSEEEIIRSSAYAAIARAVGIEWDELPSPSLLALHLDNYVDISVIEKAKRLIAF